MSLSTRASTSRFRGISLNFISSRHVIGSAHGTVTYPSAVSGGWRGTIKLSRAIPRSLPPGTLNPGDADSTLERRLPSVYRDTAKAESLPLVARTTAPRWRECLYTFPNERVRLRRASSGPLSCGPGPRPRGIAVPERNNRSYLAARWKVAGRSCQIASTLVRCTQLAQRSARRHHGWGSSFRRQAWEPHLQGISA